MVSMPIITKRQPTPARKPKILAVEPALNELAQTAAWLEEAGYQTLAANDLATAARYLAEDKPDAIICGIDSATPGSWHWVQLVRLLSDIPLLLATTRAGHKLLENSLKTQFEDYLPKPLDRERLLSRTRQLLERRRGKTDDLVFTDDGLTIDWKRLEVWLDGQPVALSPLEFKLLSLLVRRRGWVVTSEEILSYVWGDPYQTEKEYVKLYIWYLRRKIERDPSNPRWILTRRGMGYSFAEPRADLASPGPPQRRTEKPATSGTQIDYRAAS